MPSYVKQLDEKNPIPNDKDFIRINPDLFGNIRFEGVPVNAIDPKFNYRGVRDALYTMNDKKFHIINQKYEVIARLIEMPKYNIKKGTFDFTINAELIPYFKSLADGYYKFHPETLLKLSFSSGRIYQILCQNDDNGITKIHAKELKSILQLEGKYKFYSVFKKKVIDKAASELQDLFNKKESKLMFHYDKVESKKLSDDDWDRMITVKVVSLNNDNRLDVEKKQSGFDSDKSEFITYFISIVYGDNLSMKKTYNRHIVKLSIDESERLFHRFDRLYKNHVEQKININNNVDLQKIVSTILRQDYGYKNQSDTWVVH